VHRLARRGWVAISANYRLAPDAEHLDALIDTKRVIAWARANAGRYGGDPSRIYVAGGSAGGHLALSASLTANQPEYQPGFEAVDTTVCGGVGLYSFYGSASDRSGSSPHDHLHPAVPPTFIAHGGNDTLVLIRDAREFTEQLAAVSTSPVVYAELPGAQHGFDLFRSARMEAVVDGVEVFLATVEAAPPRS
jgi:acetyl esterase/lipase